MRRIVLTEWVTLDGFVAGPNDEMDFVNSLFDEVMGKYESDIVDTADTLMLGRKTYDSFAGAWPHVVNSPDSPEEEKDYARRLNAMRKVVFSKSLDKAEWNNSEVLHEIEPEAIRKLKEEPGKDILIYGSVSIVQQLTNLGLIDEYQLLVHPVVLGAGKRLFENIERKVGLKLLETKEHPSGVVRLTYGLAEAGS